MVDRDTDRDRRAHVHAQDLGYRLQLAFNLRIKTNGMPEATALIQIGFLPLLVLDLALEFGTACITRAGDRGLRCGVLDVHLTSRRRRIGQRSFVAANVRRRNQR